MRDIEYRGKSIRTGNWIVGSSLINKLGAYIVSEENPHECTQYGYIEIDEYEKVLPETVGQYTGLKDKHGKKIYEGDVLEHANEFGDHEWKTIIVFEDGMFTCKHVRNGFVSKVSPYIEMQSAEIIGNTYENLELLEELGWVKIF